MSATEGVSFVVPARTGDAALSACLDAILAQRDGRPFEILVVDDGCDAFARASLDDHRLRHGIRVLDGGGRGVAAALNLAFVEALHPLIAQIDQDVVLAAGWLKVLTEAMATAGVAAAQGWYTTDREQPLLARVTGLDLEQRWLSIESGRTDHVCTGQTLYRRAAVLAVGGFDVNLGYGADVDLSYRLVAAGHSLVIRRDARSRHAWRGRPGAWLAQQYGYGYGRLDVLAKHPRRVSGDRVAPTAMMLHTPVTASAIALLPWAPGVALALLAALALERMLRGLAVARRFRDPAGLLFAPMHLMRDLVWVAACMVWAVRRVLRIAPQPHHSMLSVRR